MSRPLQVVFVLALFTPLAGCDLATILQSDMKSKASDTHEVDPIALDRIVAQGRIEPKGGVISVFAEPGDRVESYAEGVHEGALVQKGESLGRLHSFRSRQLERQSLDVTIEESQIARDAALVAKESDVAAANGAIQQAKSAGQELAAKQKELESLASQLDLAVDECRRLVALHENSDLISDSQLAKAKHAADQAANALKVAKIQYAALESKAKTNLEAARLKRHSIAASHDRGLAGMPLESLQIRRELLNELLRESTMPAPISGTILKIYAHPGDTIARKPLLQIADLNHMICIAEVYESHLKEIQIGQPATLRSSAFDAGVEVTGQVAAIGRMILGAELKELDPFSKADVRIVEVTIRIDGGVSRNQAAKLVNLQVDVEIDTKKSAGR